MPPGSTNFTQAIDAGYGSSLRIAFGNALGEWLTEHDNMERREVNTTAGERHILTTKVVTATNNKVMSDEDDEMRIGCFERTGNLITMNPLDAYDKNIKLKGMKEGSFQVPTDRSLLDGDDSAKDDEDDSVNGDEAVELQVLEREIDSNSDTSIMGELSVRYIKN